MKAIVEYTGLEYDAMRDKFQRLLDAIRDIDRNELISIVKRHGYAHYGFGGSYTDKLVEALGRHPDEDEIIMLVDGGFSHFGAHCTIDKRHKTFGGCVSTD